MTEPARKLEQSPTQPVMQEYVEKRPWWKGGDKHSLATNWEELLRRFPDMVPVKKPPTLHTVNLCGVMLYGARDRDTETATYVKTRAIVVLMIPICFLEAYRVRDAARGWFFLGRVALSAESRRFNWIVPPAILLGIMAWVTMGVIVPHLERPEPSSQALGYGLIGLFCLLAAGQFVGLRKLARFGVRREHETIGTMATPIH
jgi:hypothetical protein